MSRIREYWDVHAARAVPFLRQAVDNYGAALARSRAVNLPGLAGAHVLAGDLHTGVQVGHQAVEEITALVLPDLPAVAHA